LYCRVQNGPKVHTLWGYIAWRLAGDRGLKSLPRRKQPEPTPAPIPAEHIFIHLRRGEQRSAEYRALNPSGLVPTWHEEDGFTLSSIASSLAKKEQTLARLIDDLPTLARLRASALERGRADCPNFALLFRNCDALGNDAPKLYLPLQVDGETVLIEAFGVDRLAAGKQLVAYHLHPETGRPWLWKDNRSPEDVPVGQLPQIDFGQWDVLWREIVDAGETLGFIESGTRASKPPSGSSVVGLSFALPAYLRDINLPPNLFPKAVDPPSLETTRAALHHLAARNFFEHREGIQKSKDGRIVKVGWLEIGMALKTAYGDEAGFGLWDITHVDGRARNDAPTQWASFASEPRAGDVTIATIIKAAKDANFNFERAKMPLSADLSKIDSEEFSGQGADVWNGKKFAEMFRRTLLFIHETGDRLLFRREHGWVAAPPGEAERAAKEVLNALGDEAARRWKAAPNDPIVKRLLAHVERTSLAKSIFAMIDMATSEPGMTAQLREFDDDPMLLGVDNGVLDLNNATLLTTAPEILVSKRCNVAYDPSAECPRFKQFMLEIQPDADVRTFLQRLMGYSLTGRVDEQAFAFFYGLGANGKSVFVELFGWLLGDYAHKIPTEMLMHHQRNPQGPSPDIVSLKGRRFVYANETEEGRRLAEARVKELTGGDTLIGRVPYGKADIAFRPTHKLIIVGNHKPEITDTSAGMWRRVVLVPFDQTIPEANRDPQLLETLKGEGSGVLNWVLAGLREWQENGLQIPTKITAATAAYRDELDILGDWICERCTTGRGCSAKKSELYFDYRQWAVQNGHQPLAQGRLTRRLNERGYKLAADKRTVHGLALMMGASVGGAAIGVGSNP
jgi:P4 family phage/plasmid primase-like protien